MLTAKSYLDEGYPHQHTFPKTQVEDMLNEFWQKKREAYEKARENFNAEQWLAREKFIQEQKHLKDGDKHD